jgi:hypothetical protein
MGEEKREKRKADDKKLNEKNANKEELLSIELQGNNLSISHQNITSVEIKYYLIDLEVLFSRNPFLLQESEDFGYVLANETAKIALTGESDLQKTTVKIPEKFEKLNVFI